MKYPSTGPSATRMIVAGAVCLALSLAVAPGPAVAGTAADAGAADVPAPASNTTPATPPDSAIPTVVVTGTSIQSADSSAYQSAPISIVTSEAIQQSGAGSIEEFFQSQPDFILSGESSYSDTGPTSGASGLNLGGTTLNLRGIGPQYTLVLLNGRRFQAEDPANIDLIPLGAIDHIEVLKSGASAVYGSDAVAGVVNIITKTGADGFTLDGYDGESGQGDNDTERFAATWGTRTDRLDFFVSAEYYVRDGLTQGQRSLSADPDLSRFDPAFPYSAFSYSSLAQIILPNGTGPLVLNQQTFTCGGYSRNPADYVPLNSALYATSCDAKLDEDKRSLIDPERKGTFFSSFDYKLTDSTTLYSDLDVARTGVVSVGNLYGADGYGDVNSPLDLSPIPANYYWNPFGEPITAVTYGFPEAGPQTDDIDTTAWRINLGVRGDLGKVHYDAGGMYFYDYANAFDYNLPTNAGLYAAEQRPGPAAVNLFCNDCNTAAQIAGIFSGASRQDWEEAAQVNAHAFAPVFTLPSGDVNLAAGLEYQRDVYIFQPAQAIVDHEFNDETANPVSAGRRYESVYVEGQLPVFGNSFTYPGAASLGVDVAARYENIEQVGSRTDPTISVRWEPLADTLAFRASYGTSFRAPPLTSMYAPVTTAGGAALINPATGLYQDYAVTTGGNLNLKPETATYVNYGLVLTPPFLHGLTLQLDHWHIDQQNIVISTSPQLVLDGIQPGGTFVTANGMPGVLSLYMNAAGQRVDGTDLDLDYRFRTDSAGRFDFRVTGTYLDSFEVDDSTGAGYVQYAGGVALASSLPSVTGLPKVRMLAGVNWDYGPVSASYQLHYAGAYTDPTIPGGVEVGHYATHNIQLNLDLAGLVAAGSWLSPVRLTFGVNDLSNAKVPIFYAGPLGGGFLANGYDTSIVDPTGRFFYGAFHVSLPNH